MKVITKCVINMESLQVIEEESYEYSGPIAECKGGGGGGGGSGKVDYPDYMKNVHKNWLWHSGSDVINISMTDVMNAALGSSPWTGQSAHNPTFELSRMDYYAEKLQDLVNEYGHNYIDDLVMNMLSEHRVCEYIEQYWSALDDRLETEVIPRLNRGMQNINAVSSSAFPIAHAILYTMRERVVAQHAAQMKAHLYGDVAARLVHDKLEYQRLASTLYVEVYRMHITAKKEQKDTDLMIDERDALWDLEVFQHGANLLAAIGGGVTTTRKSSPNTTQSAIGGALSGAAAGAMIAGASGGAIAGPVGVIGGAILGAASALL